MRAVTSEAELADWLAAYTVRAVRLEDLATELEFAQAELVDAEGGYREYQEKRVAVLKDAIRRRSAASGVVRKAGVDSAFLQELKSRVDIEDVFNYYLGVLCRGRHVGTNRLLYACPAHEDKHPSGVIFRDEQKYHCFQCNAHGDAFDALMAFRGMTFMQAVETVAGHVGMALPIKEKRGLRL